MAGAQLRMLNRVIKYQYKSEEEWRESAKNMGFLGQTPNDLLYKNSNPEARQWYTDFKYWMELSSFSRKTQIKKRKTVLARENPKKE